MAQMESVLIRAAHWPGDVDAATALLRHYAAYLTSGPRQAAGISLRGYDQELASLPQVWSPPHGVLLLAFVADKPAGCVAVKVRTDRHPLACEMKRLWVEETARGHRLGRSLIVAAVEWSRAWGSCTLLLDTVPEAMPEAVALYRSTGFTETERHNGNETAGLLFMQKVLC